MQTSEDLKSLVKEKYSQIAEENQTGSSCCGATLCCGSDGLKMNDDYSQLSGYVADADLGLGCGLPTEFAKITEGDTVVDLGSGAGNDAFVARSIVGRHGQVIGIDITPKMIEKARENAAKLNYENVQFLLGDIEHLPLANNVAHVVVSNCVLNLVPDKKLAFAETFRVLKPGGHFSVSDIVVNGNLPDEIRHAAELYAGCVSGAIQKDAYLSIIAEAGFQDISIQRSKPIALPDEILLKHLTTDELQQFRNAGATLESITVFGQKPAKSSGCCGPECCN